MYIIGRGGFGKVWKVRLRKTNELFALKEMSKVKIIDRRSEISIMSERNLLSALHHPFIVNMYFAFQDFYNLYLVMDLLNGGDLRFHIAHKKTFSENQTKFIIANMILALEYIHNKNIIHRDIKPENLVLESNGYVRITDFGVAKINEEDNSSETSGTPGYMAPEVILVQNHSFPSDFFALGVIGYEFMIGKRPYLGVGRKEIKQLIIAKQARLMEGDIPNGWSKQSMEFINSLLQRKPKKRLGYNGINEIKNHEWMKDIDWTLLENKKIEAPFIPPLNEQNYDKRYCEGVDKVGEETIERYELYLQSDLYGGVFLNYTFVNINYINKYEKQDKSKVFKINSANNSNKNKIILNKSNKNKNIYNSTKNIHNANKENNNINNIQKEVKNYSNRGINSALIRNSANSQKNSNNKNNNPNINLENKNKINFNTINKSNKKLEKNYMSNIDKFNINNVGKYNTPMVNENIMCNNYINLNFNNYPNFENENLMNKKSNQEFDVSTIKRIISNNINDLKKNMKNNYVNNNFNKNINYMKNRNEKNKINVSKKKERISVNKTVQSKYTLYKSSSMKSMGGYNSNYFNNIENKSPALIKSNNLVKTSIVKNKNKGNNKQNIRMRKEKTGISINSTNLNNNDLNINSFNTIKKSPLNNFSTSNYANNKTINANYNPNHNHHIFNRGKSEYNLKIETNDMNFISLYHQKHKNKNRTGEKSFVKTTSCDRIFIGNTSNHNNQVRNSKKTLHKERIKSTINLDKKLMSLIHKNFKNGKNKKLNYNNYNSSITNKNGGSNRNKKKFSRHDSLMNINNNNYYNNINGIFKNKNFPNVNSINISNSPIKKIIELNSINPNSKHLKSNRSNFNTVNLMTSITKTQSMRNIYNNKRINKYQKMLSQKQTFSVFSNRLKKSKMNKKLSAKNLFNSDLYISPTNNYKPRNLKIESTTNEYDIKSDNKIKENEFEYIKSI